MKSPGRNSCFCSQFLFDKGAETVKRRKDEDGYFLPPMHRTKSKLIRDINVTVKTIKILGESIGVNLCEFSNGFLGTTSKV